MENNPFQLGIRVNIDPHHLVRLARDDVRRGVQHLLHEEVRAWDGKASVAQSEDEPWSYSELVGALSAVLKPIVPSKWTKYSICNIAFFTIYKICALLYRSKTNRHNFTRVRWNIRIWASYNYFSAKIFYSSTTCSQKTVGIAGNPIYLPEVNEFTEEQNPEKNNFLKYTNSIPNHKIPCRLKRYFCTTYKKLVGRRGNFIDLFSGLAGSQTADPARNVT